MNLLLDKLNKFNLSDLIFPPTKHKLLHTITHQFASLYFFQEKITDKMQEAYRILLQWTEEPTYLNQKQNCTFSILILCQF